MVGQRMTFEDGRKPAYFGLLDLESKPFWSAEECDVGTVDLIEDLKRNHEALLEEAKMVRVEGFFFFLTFLTLCFTVAQVERAQIAK